MNALASDDSALNSSPREVRGNARLQLVTVGDIYRTRVCFSAPI